MTHIFPDLRRATGIAALMAGLLCAASAWAGGLSDALASGTAKGDIRYRYESVDQDGIANDASASTVRVRLGYETGALLDTTGYLESETVAEAGSDNYAPENAGYPTVADPAGNELNQAFLKYAGIPDTTVVLGRQRVKLDNDRHVGNVGWRQNEQTYDAALAAYSGLPDAVLRYAYVWNVNGITFGDTDVEAHLLHLSYTGSELGGVSAYGYLINNNDAPSTSSQTFGVRYTGAFDLAGTRALLNVEYATQGDYQDAPGTVDADYMLGEAGAVVSGVTAKLGYEVLGGDGTYGFQTPLATKHAFNGWADKFLSTPAGGLVDVMLSLSGQVAGVKLMGVYHDFSADTGGTDYGTELDLLAVRPVGDVKLGVKYAAFSADTAGYADTDKLWLFAETGF